jgi:hypothetical protein
MYRNSFHYCVHVPVMLYMLWASTECSFAQTKDLSFKVSMIRKKAKSFDKHFVHIFSPEEMVS